MHTDHDHEHDHSELSDTQLRVSALETILTEKGYVDPAVLDGIIEHYETKTGSHVGARAIARAWRDPQFKTALLDDATKAIASLGVPVGDHLIAVENTPARHHTVFKGTHTFSRYEKVRVPVPPLAAHCDAPHRMAFRRGRAAVHCRGRGDARVRAAGEIDRTGDQADES